MIKLVTIIGARPQIIKAAALSRIISNQFADQIHEIIVHTGQHYDSNMSQVFFDELGIPAPDYNLAVGSGSHGIQTARMIEGIEVVLKNEMPDFIVLYGDTNSTLAGAVAAAKLHIPIAHIEAGLRSFNKSMPEEINRIMCDHASTLLFSPTRTGISNLIREGFTEGLKPPFSNDRPGVFHCGDIMYDNSLYFASVAAHKSDILTRCKVESWPYILATIHRDNNTDIPSRLNAIFSAINTISLDQHVDVIMPLHPRTSALLHQNLNPGLLSAVQANSKMHIIQPVSFLDMIQLERNAALMVTDSGGVQKEAYFFGKPCIIARPETEWVEIIDAGAGAICDADEKKIVSEALFFLSNPPQSYPPVFGDGNAAAFICQTIINQVMFHI